MDGAIRFKTVEVAGEERFYLGELEEAELPDCLFVAGFDQLLLGYEKKANPFLILNTSVISIL